MNKIIIIGNGFDLAHGLKTSYNDFINDYLKQAYEIAKENRNNYEDELIRIQLPSTSESKRAIFFAQSDNFQKWIISTNSRIKYKSEFLESIISKKYEWVDIENSFFDLLFNRNNSLFDNRDSIMEFNLEFAAIKLKLEKYLIKEESKKQVSLNNMLKDSLLPILRKHEKTMILNFNYTRTAEMYHAACCKTLYNKLKDEKKVHDVMQLINIHGSLYNDNEDLIFGIGDEYHDSYKKVKDHNNMDAILQYSKSFWYQRNNSYWKLIHFVNNIGYRELGNAFNIEVYGHSCGLSDRTLLRYLFQNEKCNNIILHHYGEKAGYIKQSYNVWRHFDESELYRETLVPYNEANAFPTIIEEESESS